MRSVTSLPVLPGDRAFAGMGPWGRVGQAFHASGTNEHLHRGCYSREKVLSGPLGLSSLSPVPGSATQASHVTQKDQ